MLGCDDFDEEILRNRDILEKGTLLHLVSEKVNKKRILEPETERTWTIVNLTGVGGSAICYEAVCGDKTGRLKVYSPSSTGVKNCNSYLYAYRKLDEIRRLNPTARFINYYVPTFEILLKPGQEIETDAYIWMPDDKNGILFDDYLSKTETGECIGDQQIAEDLKNIYRRLSACMSLTECVKEFHMAGLYNLDLKPSNFLIHFPWKEDMDQCYISLFDLDTMIFCTEGSRITKVTDEYSAPELFIGKGDYRSDIYSLGIIMQKALSVYLDEKRIWVNVNDVQGMIQAIISKCLEHNPNSRYDSCEDMLENLKRLKYRLLQHILFLEEGNTDRK